MTRNPVIDRDHDEGSSPGIALRDSRLASRRGFLERAGLWAAGAAGCWAAGPALGLARDRSLDTEKSGAEMITPKAGEAIKKGLSDLTQKIDETKRKRSLLVARAKRVEAQRHIAETLSITSDRSALDKLLESTRCLNALRA